MNALLRSIPLLSLAFAIATSAPAAEPRFEKRVLTDKYFCDGSNSGDFNRDGNPDIVAGPFWYEGPGFTNKHEFYPAKEFPTKPSPTDSLFSYVWDFNADGWPDILVLGRVHLHQAFWYENPKRTSGMWPKHFVFERVKGESPPFLDVDGDGRPELVAHWEDRWGFIQPDWNVPNEPWHFTPISATGKWDQFHHGTGIGDVNGDGRLDLLLNDGWWEQPAERGAPWLGHPFVFSKDKGGAQMFATDVNGDGLADIVTALNAHGWGLAWFEQVRVDGEISFREHRFMGDRSEEPKFGVCFSQPHALTMADLDGDGLQDLIIGKRMWAHPPPKDIEPDAAPVLYWFQLQRDGKGGATFVPHFIDDQSGVGVQVNAADVNHDARPDILTVSKLGTFAFVNHVHSVHEPDSAKQTGGAVLPDRPRLLVLTDIGGDPDDQQSVVRLLVHANEFDLEGLIATAAGTLGELKEAVTKPELIRELVEAYGKVWKNLAKHADSFPDPKQLLARIKSGNPIRGRAAIGEGHDTEGSRWIIECVDREDRRPLNITIWGGQTDLAQALWRIRKERNGEAWRRFVAKLRVFDIDDQDKIHDWIFEEFPEVFYVLAKTPRGKDTRLGAYRGMYLGGDEALTSLAWLDDHVRRNHGPLGALYPSQTWTEPNPHGALKEGDTPSWFYFLPNGLGDPAHPEWGGWGGRYLKKEDGLFRDAPDTVGAITDPRAGVWRWREAVQNEFAARMDWCVTDDFKEANHPPVAVLNGDRTKQPVKCLVQPGAPIALTSADSTDPDNQRLTARWFIYKEASTNADHAALSAETGETVRLTLPPNAAPATIHVVLALTDDGTPALTRYRRAIIEVHW